MGDGSPIGDRMHMVGSLCVRDTSPTSPDPGGFMLTVGPSTVVASGAHVAVGIPTHAPGSALPNSGGYLYPCSIGFIRTLVSIQPKAQREVISSHLEIKEQTMTYQPYEGAGTQTTVPPTGYGTPPYDTPTTLAEPGSAGGDAGPVTPPRVNAPSKTKRSMVIGIAAAVVVFAVAGVFLLTPGSSPVHPPSPIDCCAPSPTSADTQYLNEVDGQGGDFNYVSDSELLSVGKAACGDFEGGNTVQETVNDAAEAAANNSAGLNDQDMAVILLAATSTLCPTYGPQLQAYLNGGDSSN